MRTKRADTECSPPGGASLCVGHWFRLYTPQEIGTKARKLKSSAQDSSKWRGLRKGKRSADGLSQDRVVCQHGQMQWTQKTMTSVTDSSCHLRGTSATFLWSHALLEMLLQALCPRTTHQLLCLHSAVLMEPLFILCLEPFPLHCSCPMFILQLDLCMD